MPLMGIPETRSERGPLSVSTCSQAHNGSARNVRRTCSMAAAQCMNRAHCQRAQLSAETRNEYSLPVSTSVQELPPEVSAASVELRTQHLILGRESVSAGRRGMGQELGCIGSHRSVSLWRIGLRIEWPTLLSHEPINEHTRFGGAVEQPIGQRCLRSLETVVEAVLAAGADCNSPAPSPTCRWSGALRSSTQGWRRAILRR